MPRRLFATAVALIALAASLTARSDTAPRLLPDGTWASASYTAVEPEATGTLRAGAATGDITPPPGAPMTGFYVTRHCATSTALEPAQRLQDKQRQIQEDPTEAPYASSQCVAMRAGPDTDGYAKTFPASSGRFGRLRAQAYVLDDGTKKVAIVSVDLPGIFGEMHQAVANSVEDLGITRDRLLISASHTHTGPGGYFQQNLAWAAVGGDVLDPRIFGAITSGIVDAIRTAHARLQPAKLAAGEALVQVNGNRRGAQFEFNPEHTLGIDPRNAPRLGMIRVDAEDGTPLGVITNFSTHGVIGGDPNTWMTGDDKGWVGRLVEEGIRADAGLPADHPIVDATLNGAQGDIGTPTCSGARWSSTSNSDFSDLACMERAGAIQAPAYLDLWRSLKPALRSDVTLDARFDMVCFCGQYVDDDPYDPFDRGPYVPANDDPAYFNIGVMAIQGEGKSPTTVFPGHHRRRPLLLGPPGASPKNVRIQLLRVGDTAFASVPGEPTITMGRRIERSVKAALAGLAERVWVAGLGNDHNAYYSTIQEYEAYMYEGGWSFYGQQSGNLIKLRLTDLAERMALAEEVPACTRERGCVENPDTSDVSAKPEPLAPDVSAGEAIWSPPSTLERFQGTSFRWWGGGPGAEWRPGQRIVTLQREVSPGAWVDVYSDLDPYIPLQYGKRYGRHRYGALFDPVADQPLGTYRFVVTGNRAIAPAQTEPYTLTSASFEVVAATTLRLVKDGSNVVSVQYPDPDRLRNFRFRPTTPSSWTLTGTLDGAPVNRSGPFALSAGQVLVVPPGGIVDAFGNTNGAQITITG